MFKVQQEFTASDEGEQRHCRPDHKLVSEIAQALTEQKVEIKSIIETPARIGDFRDGARLWDHYWEIKSRYYLEAELQYVEVHVVVYGQENWAIIKPQPEQEQPNSEPTPKKRSTRITEPDQEYKDEFVKWQLHLRSEISVHDQELAERLKQLCERLGGKIREVMVQMAFQVERDQGGGEKYG